MCLPTPTGSTKPSDQTQPCPLGREVDTSIVFQFKKQENGHSFKRDSSAKNPKYIFIVLFIHLDRFGVSCKVLEIGCRDICLLSNIMELDGTRLMMLAAMFLSKNHDPVTQNDPQTLL